MVTVHGPRGGDRLRRAHMGVYTGKGTIAFIVSTCALICSEDRRAYLINGGEGGPVGGDLSTHVIAQWSLACCLHARCLPFALACFVITHLLVFLRAEIATSAAVLVTSNQDFKHVLAQVLPGTLLLLCYHLRALHLSLSCFFPFASGYQPPMPILAAYNQAQDRLRRARTGAGPLVSDLLSSPRTHLCAAKTDGTSYQWWRGRSGRDFFYNRARR